DYWLLAYGLALSTSYIVLGAVALDRGGPTLLSACLPWGLLGLMVVLNVELIRILDSSWSRGGHASWPVYLAYAVVVPGVCAFVALARERRFAVPLGIALLFALLVPTIFWMGGAMRLSGKVVVASLVLASAVGLIAAGA
ncbi:hypothetical protein AB4156_43570, partial [Cupriavidus sp. 2MCAB6]